MGATWPAVRDMRPLAQVRDLACSDSRRRHAPGMAVGESGAQERTRTSTPLRAPAPEAGASTNSATWARGQTFGRGRRLRGASHGCQCLVGRRCAVGRYIFQQVARLALKML